MKKSFKFFAIAVAVFAFAACNNTPAEETDTTVVEAAVVEEEVEAIDTIAVEATPAEEPVAETPAAKPAKKPAVKKEEPKEPAPTSKTEEVKVSGNESATVVTTGGKMKRKAKTNE